MDNGDLKITLDKKRKKKEFSPLSLILQTFMILSYTVNKYYNFYWKK